MSDPTNRARSDLDKLKDDARDHALHAFGTSYIFQLRAARLKRKLDLVNYVGLAIPLLVGSIVLTIGTRPSFLPKLLVVAGLILAVQAVVSLWAIIAHWVDEHPYAIESASANLALARRYDELFQESSAARFRTEYRLIRADDESRRQLDMRRTLTGKELRKGMRAGLRQYRRECVACKTVPTSMNSTNCDTCGNF